MLAAALLGACDGGKRDAAAALEEARVSVKSSREWGGDMFAAQLHASAERELATAETSFDEKRYAQVRYPAQRAIDAARLARAQAVKLPKHSPKAEKKIKARVKKS